MFYSLVIAVHVIACVILIAVILLQAGRGGGLSEAFGGGGSPMQTIFGTKTNVFLARATATAAILYLITCLLLGVMTAKRGKSLLRLQRKALPQSQRLPVTKPLKEAKEEKTLDEAKKGLPEAKPEAVPTK
ncbi:MAG: preprotein translocase subunit SecG [Candidatus Omnitrophica bacterium]|nr:preprotein translocase subunit SecG [Candidatus Omnitrophota bacterium]